jgi:hypothetical protein
MGNYNAPAQPRGVPNYMDERQSNGSYFGYHLSSLYLFLSNFNDFHHCFLCSFFYLRRPKDEIPSYHAHRMDSFGSNGAQLSPGIPPQFNANFLQDDEGDSPAVGSPVAPSHVKKYLNSITHDSSQFPVLLRRDSIPGMVRISSSLFYFIFWVIVWKEV